MQLCLLWCLASATPPGGVYSFLMGRHLLQENSERVSGVRGALS